MCFFWDTSLCKPSRIFRCVGFNPSRIYLGTIWLDTYLLYSNVMTTGLEEERLQLNSAENHGRTMRSCCSFSYNQCLSFILGQECAKASEFFLNKDFFENLFGLTLLFCLLMHWHGPITSWAHCEMIQTQLISSFICKSSLNKINILCSVPN